MLNFHKKSKKKRHTGGDSEQFATMCNTILTQLEGTNRINGTKTINSVEYDLAVIKGYIDILIKYINDQTNFTTKEKVDELNKANDELVKFIKKFNENECKVIFTSEDSIDNEKKKIIKDAINLASGDINDIKSKITCREDIKDNKHRTESLITHLKVKDDVV